MADRAGVSARTCLGCAASLPDVFLDLGVQPLANAFVRPEDAGRPEPRYPLAVVYCARCHLVQLTATAPPEALFGDYLYFTSFSDHFLEHARAMAATLTERFALGAGRRVLEIASNDGYLLRFFLERGVPVLGVEPARNVAAEATARGIPTLNRFFGPEVVDEIVETFGRAQVIVGNNVLAHVPAINDFFAAVRACLELDGAAVFEFPYLGDLLARTAFDTIYHEHVFYFSLAAVVGLAQRAGLEVFDVEHHPVHGESLRIFVQHAGARPIAPSVAALHADEDEAGLTRASRYAGFSRDVTRVCGDLTAHLRGLRAEGRRVAAYGAPAKGTVLLNACGVGADVLEFAVDRSPHKQGRLVPGVGVPIRPVEDLLREMPDYALLLPWNLADEIVAQQAAYLDRGGAFIVAVPTIRVIDRAR
ncbi:MAG TPA: class I SAM-dependent methyltransferase [Methylomirabilota bacterium]|jgi:SAM-dependent methyltransferase|nr:class I SAM-dependent methyltransferase [Methylomirabilota bacterium]